MQLNLRILWPKGKIINAVSEPGFKASSLGYNALVSHHATKDCAWVKEITHLEEIGGKNPDYFLWVSRWKEENFFNQPDSERWTRKELLAQELEKVEGALSKGANRAAKLIFLLPGEEKIEWISYLAKVAGPKTFLAFSPYWGEPTKDFLPPQPIWKKISEGEEFCSTPLLPILNTGMVDLGGGLWPTIPFDLYDRFYSRIPSSLIRGALTLTPTLPSKPGFLQCALWVGAQLLEKDESPDKKLAEWFLRHKNGIDYFSSALLLRNLRTLALEASFLRYLRPKKIGLEESRILLDGLTNKIQTFQFLIEREHPSLMDPFIYFARDVRRILSNCAAQLNVSYSTHPDESLDSFWTHKMGSSVVFQEEPSRGKPGSKQESIFLESWT